MSTALYTGSFDPITKGHLDIIEQASKMFDHVIVGVGTNPAKKHTFSQEERIALMTPNIRWSNVKIVQVPVGKLTADFAYEHRAVILKGVRMNASDFDYEWLMADINRAHVNGLRTIILPASPHEIHKHP
jgi:pantetheine-phosphate adenylyltransferase